MEEKTYNKYKEFLDNIKKDSMELYGERYVEIFIRDDVEYLSDYVMEITLVISGNKVTFEDYQLFSKIVSRYDPNWEISSDVISKQIKKADQYFFTSAKVI